MRRSVGEGVVEAVGKSPENGLGIAMLIQRNVSIGVLSNTGLREPISMWLPFDLEAVGKGFLKLVLENGIGRRDQEIVRILEN